MWAPLRGCECLMGVWGLPTRVLHQPAVSRDQEPASCSTRRELCSTCLLPALSCRVPLPGVFTSSTREFLWEQILIPVFSFVQMRPLLCSKWTVRWLAKQTGDQLVTRHGTRALSLSWTG